MRHQRSHVLVYVLRVVIVLAAVGSTFFVLTDPSDAATRRKLGKSINFVPNEKYESECGSCHLGFSPGFLPRASWNKLVDGLSEHFGEDASLDEADTKAIREYLLNNAADSKQASPRSRKMAKLMEGDRETIRITETPFWVRKHMSVKGWVWKREKVGSRARCEACHIDAKEGLYSEYTVKVPE